MVPSRNLTVRAAPVKATAVAASRANAPDKVTNELSATQRSLNSRRLSNLVSLLFTTLFLRLRARSEDRSAEFHSASSPRRLKPPAAESRYGGNSGFVAGSRAPAPTAPGGSAQPRGRETRHP